MERIAQERVVGCQQAKVNSPGIEADAGKLVPVGRGGEVQSVLDLVPQAQYVPVQIPQCLHRTIRKAMQFLQPEPLTVQVADHGSAALRAEVTGKESGCLSHGLSLNYLISCPPVTLIA